MLRGLFTGRQPNLSGIPSFDGPTTAPVTSQEQNFLDQIGQAAGASPNQTASQNLLTQTLGGQFLSPESNPFLKATIESATRPVLETFNDVIAPQLRSQFTAAGQVVQNEGSSPFAQAFGRAGKDLLNKIGDISSNISFQNFAQERGRQQEAVNQSLNLDSAKLDNLVKGLQSSALPRIIEQFGIDRGIELFNSRVSTLLEALRLAGGVSAPTVTSLPGSPGADVGGLFGGLGGLGLGIAELVPVLSDRRAKTDIKKIGKLDSGPNVYTYRYKGHPFKQIGVMAQEVEEVQPEAVVSGTGGFKFLLPALL
ncbi:tail fiber domain-containing protein [Pelagibius sp.]|uniref:tail fiber domain-containing protein n=1 Tax=Pelagibius sp. TaxID=1931238 RepID=UPI003BAE5492